MHVLELLVGPIGLAVLKAIGWGLLRRWLMDDCWVEVRGGPCDGAMIQHMTWPAERERREHVCHDHATIRPPTRHLYELTLGRWQYIGVRRGLQELPALRCDERI